MRVSQGSKARARILFALVAVTSARFASKADGQDLQTIRDDVRNAQPSAAASQNSNASSGKGDSPGGGGDTILSDLFSDEDSTWIGLFLGIAAITAPIWGPAEFVNDKYTSANDFEHLPYHDNLENLFGVPGNRGWSTRFDVDYSNDFGKLDSVGGHFLLETSSRIGLDAQVGEIEERLPGADRDRLWLGDANLIYRFAQSDERDGVLILLG